ncbi:MAG: DUF6483 family protein [Ktedonobacteraceae bacterium]|nr:DUF6483 family protein [Chloroflexota bacterium]
MINRDYLLRMIEQFTRAVARIIFLREANRHQDALIFIDDLFRQSLGLGSSQINSASEDMLLALVTSLGTLNVEKCLWIALLLKAEGDTYEDLEKENESYPRYLKSLFLFLEVMLREEDSNTIKESPYFVETEEILTRLDAYELPVKTKRQVMQYYEKTGRYARAEDLLFELVETEPANAELFAQGQAFYARLQQKSDADLVAGNFSRAEVEEGQEQLAQLEE